MTLIGMVFLILLITVPVMLMLISMMLMRMERVMNVILMPTMMESRISKTTVGSSTIPSRWTRMVMVRVIFVKTTRTET